MPTAQINAGNGIAFLLSAEMVYAVVAAACSSPQTTELNADSRAETLMKWVYIGLAQSAGLVTVAAMIEPRHAKAIIGGGGIAALLMWTSYKHAKSAGLASSEPGTES